VNRVSPLGLVHSGRCAVCTRFYGRWPQTTLGVTCRRCLDAERFRVACAGEKLCKYCGNRRPAAMFRRVGPPGSSYRSYECNVCRRPRQKAYNARAKRLADERFRRRMGLK